MKISPNPSTGSWTRRGFVGTAGMAGLAALATGCATPGSKPSTPLVGTQLYGWGQYYEREHRSLSAHLDEALSAIRDCGYDYAEGSLDAGNPEANRRFAEQLKARGLQPVSLYTGGRLHDATAAENVMRVLAAARVAREAGFYVLNCNPDPIGRDKTDAELQTQAAALVQLAEGLRSFNMRLGIHHHTPEMRQGAREFHSNFRNSPAGLVGFCYDVHWVYRGGILPDEALRDYGDRVVSWHLRQSREKIWWEDLASGDIDYAAVAAVARRRRIPPLYTVELALENGTKVTRSVVENHRRSREYVREIFKA